MEGGEQGSMATSQEHHNKQRSSQPERITQLQCLDSNSQLQSFFTQAINESFKYLPGVLQHVYNEVQLLVGLAEYRLTVAVSQPHPGDLLQNIQYHAMSSKVKVLYLVLTVILPYLKRKLSVVLVRDATGWKSKLLNLLNLTDKILSALSLVNLSVFIYDGKYRNLTQRVLRIPMKFIHGESARILDFTLMNRKIIWHIYELFLKTILPYAHDLFGSTLKNIFYLNSYLDVEGDRSQACMYCQETAKMPMKTSCEHLACYYCYSASNPGRDKAQGKAEQCRNCGSDIKEWQKMF